MDRLCMTCSSHEGHPDGDKWKRLALWQNKIRAFWSKHGLFAKLSECAPLLVILLIFCAYVPSTRKYTVYPLVLAVLLLTVNEFVPFSIVPFNHHNVITSGSNQYVTAVMVASMGTLVFLSLAGIAATSESLGNMTFGLTSSTRPVVHWSDPTTLVSTWIFIASILFFISLVVSRETQMMVPFDKIKK